MKEKEKKYQNACNTQELRNAINSIDRIKSKTESAIKNTEQYINAITNVIEATPRQATQQIKELNNARQKAMMVQSEIMDDFKNISIIEQTIKSVCPSPSPKRKSKKSEQ